MRARSKEAETQKEETGQRPGSSSDPAPETKEDATGEERSEEQKETGGRQGEKKSSKRRRMPHKKWK